MVIFSPKAIQYLYCTLLGETDRDGFNEGINS